MSAPTVLRGLRAAAQPRNLARDFSTTPASRNMAKMTLIGRLAATPESTQTASGQTLVRYAVGVSSGPRDNKETSWFNVAAFLGEGAEESPRALLLGGLEKGTLVYVEAEGKMATLEPREGEERGRKVLNLVQRECRRIPRIQRVVDSGKPHGG